MSVEPDHVGDPDQFVRVGRVVSVDRGTATCVVAVGDPDSDGGETLTGDIPWLVARAGKTLAWAPPSEDEQVILLAPGGDIAQAVAVPGLYSTAFPAPGSGARQFIRFEDGAEFGYDPESGQADATLPAGGTLTINAPGGVVLNADGGVVIDASSGVTIEGSLSVTGSISATEDVTADGVSLRSHRHTGVQPGSGVSGGPQQ